MMRETPHIMSTTVISLTNRITHGLANSMAAAPGKRLDVWRIRSHLIRAAGIQELLRFYVNVLDDNEPLAVRLDTTAEELNAAVDMLLGE